jgi:hypothetical protein
MGVVTSDEFSGVGDEDPVVADEFGGIDFELADDIGGIEFEPADDIDGAGADLVEADEVIDLAMLFKLRTMLRWGDPHPLRKFFIAMGLLIVGVLSGYVMMEVIPAPGWLHTVSVFTTFLGGAAAGVISARLAIHAALLLFGEVGGQVVYCLLALAPVAAFLTYYYGSRQDWSWELPGGWSALFPAILPLFPFVLAYARVAIAIILEALGSVFRRLSGKGNGESS